MALPLFYSNEPITSAFITLDESTSRHVVQVLRMTTGEHIQLTDGKGSKAEAVITTDHKIKSVVRVLDCTMQPRPAQEVSIAMSLLKNGARFEWFLEKATEIGVGDIIPVLCERTEKQHFRYERMQSILVTAMLQSQQYWLPVLHRPTPFRQVANDKTYSIRLLAHCEDNPKAMITHMKNSSCRILIGPEGDFSQAEIDMALSEGFQAVSLGHNRLRSETAGVVAATLLCL